MKSAKQGLAVLSASIGAVLVAAGCEWPHDGPCFDFVPRSYSECSADGRAIELVKTACTKERGRYEASRTSKPCDDPRGQCVVPGNDPQRTTCVVPCKTNADCTEREYCSSESCGLRAREGESCSESVPCQPSLVCVPDARPASLDAGAEDGGDSAADDSGDAATDGVAKDSPDAASRERVCAKSL